MREQFLPFGKPSFGAEEEEAIVRVLRSGWIGMGPETINFEKELAQYLGAPEVVSVNSCTSALFLSLLVHGVGPGDEVIVPSLTWCSTANAALYLGAKAVFCDVDPETMCATWETIRPRITKKTKAVIVVHYGGLAAETRAIRDNLPKHVALVEDAAHALGTTFPDGRRVGSDGNLTCFSFYANKNLSCGEGGAIALFDSRVAERLRRLRLHGLVSDAWKRFQHKQVFEMGLDELGYKMNFTDMQACIARIQLKRQAELQRQRMVVVDTYCRRLPDIAPDLTWQSGLGSPAHAAHLFVVQLPVEHLRMSRDEILLAMRERNIGASIHYTPLHRMSLYNAEVRQADLPVVEHLGKRILTLPISASMGSRDCTDVLGTFEAVLSSARMEAIAEPVQH